MKDVKDYLKEARIPFADLETVLKRLQEDAYAAGYRAAGDHMLEIAETRGAKIERIADFARKAS